MLTVGLWACGDGGDAPAVADIEIPGTVEDAAGGSVAVEVRILDAAGAPLVGVPVTFSPVGGGTANPAETTSDAEGSASTSWTLGGEVGTQNLKVTAGNLSYSVSASVEAAEASTLVLISGGDQQGIVGEALGDSIVVEVRDRFGNPVSGTPLTVTTTNGEGAVSPAGLVSDSVGRVRASWVLGGKVGEQSLTLRHGLLSPLQVSAMAEAGPFSSLVLFSGSGQQGTVGEPLSNPVVVKTADAFGNPISGVSVTFDPASGTTDATTVVSGADGLASVGWTLGTTAGNALLRVRASGASEITALAIAKHSTPDALQIASGDGQTGTVLTELGEPVGVRVVDRFGNPIPGTVVVFTPQAGHGTVQPSSVPTGQNGVATTRWTLGASTGSQTLVATVPEIGSVSIQATGSAAGGGGGGGGSGAFTLEVRYVGTPSPAQASAFESARNRWQSAITGDLPNTQITIGAGACGVGHPAMNEVVDDLVVWVVLEAIDGPGGVLGSAGPCMIRGGSFLPAVGSIRLDTNDLALMESSGTLEDVILHEMGHVLGVGTLWQTKSLLVGAGTADPHFTGSEAQARYVAMGGTLPNPVPVENTGGSGTRDSHWRESDLGTELMTGWISHGSNPMSALTIGSLQDLGYSVNFGAADGMSLAPSGLLMDRADAPRFRMIEGYVPPPMIVGGAGGS